MQIKVFTKDMSWYLHNHGVRVMRRMVIGLSGVVFVLFVSAVFAVEYGGIGGRPAYPRSDNARTESIFIHTLNPGQVQNEGVSVVNNSAEAKTILVYAVDSTPSTGGAFACEQLSQPKDDVGAWITLEKEDLLLESGTNELIPFTITVPQTASVGEHNGCIVIQEKLAKPDGKSGVNLSFRTGLRVAVTIPGVLERNVEEVMLNWYFLMI